LPTDCRRSAAASAGGARPVALTLMLGLRAAWLTAKRGGKRPERAPCARLAAPRVVGARSAWPKSCAAGARLGLADAQGRKT